MTEPTEQTGEGTLYDTDNNELATVACRIVPTPAGTQPGRGWVGEIFFADEQMTVDPGLYVLATEDGTEVNIEIEPPGSADGDRRHVRFNGVGSLGQRIV